MSCGRLISAVLVVVPIAKGEKYQVIFSSFNFFFSVYLMLIFVFCQTSFSCLK